jgi:hypothetical protein
MSLQIDEVHDCVSCSQDDCDCGGTFDECSWCGECNELDLDDEDYIDEEDDD